MPLIKYGLLVFANYAVVITGILMCYVIFHFHNSGQIILESLTTPKLPCRYACVVTHSSSNRIPF
jgi:hypothetical protein